MKNLENWLNDAFHKTQLDSEAKGGIEKKSVIYCNQTKTDENILKFIQHL